MDTVYFGFYVFNATRGLWLQEGSYTWGAFESAREFDDVARAELTRGRVGGTDTTFTMGCVQS